MKDATLNNLCGFGDREGDLTNDELGQIVSEALTGIPANSRVLAIIPDKTRDDNTHILFPAAAEHLSSGHTQKFDVLIAQGTHGPMSRSEKLTKIGLNEFGGYIYDHKWDDPSELVSIGNITSDQVRTITDGIYDEPIKLTINKLLAPEVYDIVLIFGATVPHEVAGFAGGAKYFFPGVAGAELTHKTHWLAALATIEKIIGRVETPTRHLIEAAADRITAKTIAFTSVNSRESDGRL
ncbi:MAG TPA: lactate racemase domain-containing protein, partial [Pyrinomonadaceae bacterium]|nr:lactate racemase domain-containing protein [Pyrinomonadaceae bacterium]